MIEKMKLSEKEKRIIHLALTRLLMRLAEPKGVKEIAKLISFIKQSYEVKETEDDKIITEAFNETYVLRGKLKKKENKNG